MQENLIRLLKIKKDDIIKNIDNLNYLNEELRKNERDLDYIHENLNLFETEEEYDVLKFDSIEKSDFNKLLSMLDSQIEAIFQDKNCNYEGIIYIIRGIRQGIDLSLTEEQTDVILRFIASLEEKATDLVINIKNLNDAKFELDETDLGTLEKSLSKYNSITTKIENHEYLCEIDEIIEAMEFSNVISEEKNNILEFIIRFNSDIYLKCSKEETRDNFDVEETFSNLEIKNDEDEFPNTADVKSSDELLMDDTFNFEEENKFVSEISENNHSNIDANDNVDTIPFTALNEIKDESLNSDLKNHDVEFEETNTVDLEQIIQKIDAKLKELNNSNDVEVEPVQDDLSQDEIALEDKEETVEEFTLPLLEEEKFNNEVNVVANTVDVVKLQEMFNKYNVSSSFLEEIDLESNNRLKKIEQILEILEQNKILDELKGNYIDLFKQILLLNDINVLDKIFETLRNNFYLDEEDYKKTLTTSFLVLPGILLDTKISNDFIKNVEFFKQNQINLINLFDNYRELLIVENDLLLENYEKIKCYNLKLDNDNVKYLLYIKNIEEKLDYYIETKVKAKGFLGTSEEFDGIDYYTKYPYKLNNINRDVILKLKYSIENNQKIFGSKNGILAGEIANSKVNILTLPSEYLGLYFDNDFNFIDRSELLHLIGEFKNLKIFDLAVSDVIIKLDSLYKVSDLRYEINNILISRVKVIRLYNYLIKKGIEKKKSLIIALAYNSVIKNEDYNIILEIVDNLLGGN